MIIRINLVAGLNAAFRFTVLPTTDATEGTVEGRWPTQRSANSVLAWRAVSRLPYATCCVFLASVLLRKSYGSVGDCGYIRERGDRVNGYRVGLAMIGGGAAIGFYLALRRAAGRTNGC